MNSSDVFRLWEKIGVPGENLQAQEHGNNGTQNLNAMIQLCNYAACCFRQ